MGYLWLPVGEVLKRCVCVRVVKQGRGRRLIEMLIATIKLLFGTASCLSAAPALSLVFLRRRHFELFVAVSQIIAALLYSVSDSISSDRLFFVKTMDWHFISDVLTETYVCLLALHLFPLRSEGLTIVLRYAALAGAVWAKMADGWEGIIAETLVVSFFVVPAVALALHTALAGRGGRGAIPAGLLRALAPPVYNVANAPLAAGAGLLGAVLLVLEQRVDTSTRLFNALARCAFGGASWALWGLLKSSGKDFALPGGPLFR